MTSPELSSLDKPAPNITQVDPPTSYGSLTARLLIAAVIVGVAIAAYFYLGKGKPVASGDVARISLYPIHSETSGGGPGPGMEGQAEGYDQLLVFAQVHIHNLSKDPITITELRGNVTLTDPVDPEQPIATSRAASPKDFNRLFTAYPQLSPLRMDPILRGTSIAPGATAEGLLIFNYSMTKDAWDKRKHFAVVVSFRNNVGIEIDGTHS